MERNKDCLYCEVCDYEEPCKKLCKRHLITKSMLEQSNIPKVRQKVNVLIPDNCDIDAFTKLADIRENIVDFVKSGNSLYIASSTCGNGKTTWAIKLMLQYFNDIWEHTAFEAKGVFISVNTFLYESKQNISRPSDDFEDLKERLLQVDLVVWDDIAVTNMSNYNFDLLYTIINQRAFEGRCNIFTGNVLPGELEKYMGNRLTSRILDGEIVVLKGKDKRINGSVTNFV